MKQKILKMEEVLENGFILNHTNKEIKIPLRNYLGEIVNWAISSLEKLELLKNDSFHLTKNKYGAIYVANQKSISLHELVFGRKARKGHKIDHKNRNTLDCRTENLREATNSQNAHNRTKQKNASSKYVGVYSDKKSKKWFSIVIKEGERYNLGKYENELDAAYIHDIWDIHLYGDFAVCNTHEDGTPLISDDLRKDILLNGVPKGYERRQNPKRKLPQNIYRYNYNGYSFKVEKQVNGKIVTKYVKTFEEAKDVLNEIIQKAEKEKIEELNNRKILRNKRGVPYIPANNNGKVIKFFVNKEIWRDLVKYTWSTSSCENYAHTKDENGKWWKMHNYIYSKYIGKLKDGHTVDHIISSHPRDNRMQNLRLMSYSGQTHNTKQKKVVGLPRGVGVCKGKFGVVCHKKYGGRFNTIEEAALKYNVMAKAVHGENANLNIITTEGTTSKNFFKNVSLEYIKNISTVVQLQELLRAREEWKKELKIGYDDIRQSTLKQYLDMVIEYAENNMEQDFSEIDENCYKAPIEEEESEDYGIENYFEDEEIKIEQKTRVVQVINSKPRLIVLENY